METWPNLHQGHQKKIKFPKCFTCAFTVDTIFLRMPLIIENQKYSVYVASELIPQLLKLFKVLCIKPVNACILCFKSAILT